MKVVVPAPRPKVYIAVMGVTGAGKSTFIRTATCNQDVDVGHDFKSSTSEVFPYEFRHEGRDIVLIDTPGFNDTTRSETEVLKEIAGWLEHTYRSTEIKLTGIIYMQAISDRRIYGSTLRNLKMFRQLCGDEPLKHVVLTTTGWGVVEKVGEMEKAIANENQLQTDPMFWQPMMERGSHMTRFVDTRESALEIIMKLVDMQTIVLKIQQELVDEQKFLVDTAAGITVSQEIKKLEEQYKKQLDEIQKEMQEALEDRDQELQEALSEHKASILKLRNENRRARDNLEYERRNAERRQNDEVQSLKMELENQKLLAEIEKEDIKAQLEQQAEEQRNVQLRSIQQLAAQLRGTAVEPLRTRTSAGRQSTTEHSEPPPVYTEREVAATGTEEQNLYQ